MDAWTALNSRQTARPRFDSLRDHVEIKAFLERRRNNMTVHEISEEPSNQTKDEDRSSPDEGRNEHGSRNTTPDTGFESRRGSLVSQVVHWGRPESRNNSIPSLPHHPCDQSLSLHTNYPVMPQLTPVSGLGGDSKRHHHYHHHHAAGVMAADSWMSFSSPGCHLSRAPEGRKFQPNGRRAI